MIDPHPDMRGCFRYIPPLMPGQLAHAPGSTFTCPECGRTYTREKSRGGGLAMWRAARDRQRPTAAPTVAH